MTSKNPSDALYGIQRSRQGVSQKDITSSSTLAFTTHLSSLISKDADSNTNKGRTRPSKTAKSDIFSVHNKGTLKRAAADEAEDVHGVRPVHQKSDDIGQVDAATLQRSKRRMQEKATLYEDLKRGHHLADGASSSDEEGLVGNNDDEQMSRMRRRERNALVDFDRKWAEEEEKRQERGGKMTGSLVEYEDEFGRTRRGTKAEAAEAARLIRLEAGGRDEVDKSRPSRPTNLIHGETIQSHAFNPDAAMASQMAYLASKQAEVRTRGTGFYKFSSDEKVREREMEELLNTRQETERERQARSERKAERDRVKDERRKKIQELRSRHHADRFLKGLSVDLG
ncbi:hypothetical protein BGW36DRAFT_384847 [Talaromyces proteolyticus]|uniref:Uncharacterized protein n=1 Tax=Talaromyces proteolyticus TaxID=1131652 RepID=A0AAD4PX19_9EURO|nr:uncharacterized protein BGW36DRAFT_384847 [Talaromyces proteolyticus]KAH8692626.1 hypothetical protein BGW36DRAFT_384847 [Talaromyces proteolyticus]